MTTTEPAEKPDWIACRPPGPKHPGARFRPHNAAARNQALEVLGITLQAAVEASGIHPNDDRQRFRLNGWLFAQVRAYRADRIIAGWAGWTDFEHPAADLAPSPTPPAKVDAEIARAEAAAAAAANAPPLTPAENTSRAAALRQALSADKAG